MVYRTKIAAKEENKVENDTNIILYIKNNMGSFSKRQKMIGNYIIEHYDKAAYMTAAKLSEEVGVSESTVVRFSAELGFDGYQKLQRVLQEVTQAKLTAVQRMEIASQRMGDRDVLTDVLEMDMDKIQKTLLEIDHDEFKKSVEILTKAKKIYIIGARSAAALASFADFYFNLIFKDVKVITSGGSDLFEQILRLESGDAVFGISFPRYSKSTIKALDYAKEHGAYVIGLTDSINSPIVKASTHCLIARSDMNSFADSLVAPMSVINALIAAIGMNKKQEVSETLERLEHIWDVYGVYDKRSEEI